MFSDKPKIGQTLQLFSFNDFKNIQSHDPHLIGTTSLASHGANTKFPMLAWIMHCPIVGCCVGSAHVWKILLTFNQQCSVGVFSWLG